MVQIRKMEGGDQLNIIDSYGMVFLKFSSFSLFLIIIIKIPFNLIKSMINNFNLDISIGGEECCTSPSIEKAWLKLFIIDLIKMKGIFIMIIKNKEKEGNLRNTI